MDARKITMAPAIGMSVFATTVAGGDSLASAETWNLDAKVRQSKGSSGI